MSGCGWPGHRLHAEVSITVDASLSVEQGHAIAKEVQHELLHHFRYLSEATIHVDPMTASGPEYHHIEEHAHGGCRGIHMRSRPDFDPCPAGSNADTIVPPGTAGR